MYFKLTQKQYLFNVLNTAVFNRLNKIFSDNKFQTYVWQVSTDFQWRLKSQISLSPDR